MTLFIISSIFISCSEKEFLTEEQSISLITANGYGSCIQVFSYDNESIPIEIRKIGYYHNQILGQFTRPPYILDMCNRLDYQPLQVKLDQLIQNNVEYYDFFGSTQTLGIDSLYMDILKVCHIPKSNPDTIMMAVVDNTCLVLQNYLTSFEIEFFKDFFIDGLSDNVKPIIEYVEIIEQNQNKFIDNGNFAYAILSIYDNSYCFWSEYNSNRVCPWCFRAAIGDTVGAFVNGAWDLGNNGGAPSDNFLKTMGRGALEGSIPYFGGKIANWLGI